jgi:hypothetical protein
VEPNFHTNLHTYRPAVFLGGLEAPLLDGFNSLGIQSESQSSVVHP